MPRCEYPARCSALIPAHFGISHVDGMTLSARGTLIVLGAPARELIEIQGR
jgi:hypothetical protein